MYDVIIGHYGEDKNIPFGGQKLSYRVETLHTGWEPLDLQHIFRFFEILKILDFVIIFLKKKYFLNFLGSKKQNLKNPRQQFCRPCFSMFYPFFVCIWLKNYFWWIFKHLPLIGPKSREVTLQNATYSKKCPADFDFLGTRRRQIDARRGVPSFMSIQ